MMKPYRLINTLELETLTQHFTKVIDLWNSTYSLYPLTLSLSLPPKNYVILDKVMVYSALTPLALVDTQYIKPMNQLLFGEDAPCYSPTSEALFLVLLEQLFKKQPCCLRQSPLPNWCYPGSTCLILTLKAHTQQITLVLSPDWVYEQLPKSDALKTVLSPIDETLGREKVTFNIELNPINLPVSQLVSLQVGDVIELSHLLTAYVHVTKNKQVIAQGELGLSSNQKSIQLRTSL